MDNKMVRLTCMIRLGTVNDTKVLNVIRAEVALFGGEFNLLHEDATNMDKMTLDFVGWNQFQNFMDSDGFKLIQRLKPIAGTYTMR